MIVGDSDVTDNLSSAAVRAVKVDSGDIKSHFYCFERHSLRDIV